ncbi:hypothetical protein AC578_5715 [Pseudocercospora eumusae]|uniref:Heterokaryon incompatibility domain-containing protein n=1 Tax=Pseudocercospora eumusae TaxID=321146 RepID=A0A139HEK6_9PEZI|nr:hypothetical protein AC578_5715 [Pseudocercospora eumusae]
MVICKSCLACIRGTADVVEHDYAGTSGLEGEAAITYRHHATTESFRKALEVKCRICTALWTKLGGRNQTTSEGISELSASASSVEDDNEGSSARGTPASDEMIGEHRCQVRIEPDETCVGLMFEWMHRDGGDEDVEYTQWLLRPTRSERRVAKTKSTGSADSMQLARQWLRRCLSDHHTCQEAHIGWYPVRLLDLGQRRSGSTFKLVETASLQLNEPYITLSHCWGGGEVFKLTADNKSSLESGYRIDKLSKTFQDAMKVCRELGVRYLWIDSLCIIQDAFNPVDWMAQAGDMHKIYSHGLCNIAATASRSGEEGLFRDRDPALIGREYIELSNAAAQRPISPGLYELLPIEWRLEQVDYAPLNQRAWVLQERLLAKRTLHFTQQELLWECLEADFSESFAAGIPDELAKYTLKAIASLRPAPSQSEKHQEAERARIFNRWWTIADQYSSSLLTVTGDRAMAVAGVAKAFRDMLKDTYLAGMWKSRLAVDLMWHAELEDDRQETRDLSAYRAPSFSWLSLECRVVNWFNTDEYDVVEPLYQVIDLYLEHVSADTTALIKHGELFVRGHLVQARLEKPSEDDADHRWNVAYYDDTITLPDHTRHKMPTHTKANEHYFLLAGKANRGRMFCFILEVVDAQDGTYRRIGLSQTAIRDFPDLPGTFGRIAGKGRYPCNKYDEATGLYTIRIV